MLTFGLAPPYDHGVVSDLDFLSAYLAVDRRDLDVMAAWLRADGCPEADVVVQLHDMLNARSERTVPEQYTGAEVLDDDDRFTVRRQPPGWSRSV
jgi:hypothetical protein